MVACDAGRMEAVQLLSGQDAVGGAQVDGQFLFHAAVGSKGFLEILSHKGPAACYDGKTVGTGFLVGAGIGDDRFLIEETVLLASRVMARCLGAVFAVFTAAAAAAVDNGAEIDVVSAEMTLQLTGAFFEGGQGTGQHGLDEGIFPGQTVSSADAADHIRNCFHNDGSFA